LADDRIPGQKRETAELLRRDEDVVGSRQVAGLQGSQEAEPVGDDLENPVGDEMTVLARLRLDDPVDQLLPAQDSGVFDFERARQLDQARRIHRLQLANIHVGPTLPFLLMRRDRDARRAHCRRDARAL
jgi:hypothetical protein